MFFGGARICCLFWMLVNLGIAAAASSLVPTKDGTTVYDSANNITWLADANLAVNVHFGLPTCTGSGALPTCINPSGSMNYQSAAAWVAAMNAAHYLGHSNWQLPTNPLVDNSCPLVGPNGGSFGMNCTGSALGSLFYNGLGLKQGTTAVPMPASTVGPFSNLQPYLYWSQVSAGSSGYNTFSFASGWLGANTNPHVMYVWPMISGKIAGTPASTGKGLQTNPDGQTVYDPVANVTWLANANIAATNTFGMPACNTAGSTKLCVDPDGSMSWDSAGQFIANMNAANNGAGYLGQKNWELPPIDPNCNGFNCGSAANPMGELFYGQFALLKGMSLVAAPDIGVGPFRDMQPYLYWACQANTIQSPCSTDVPAANFEWSFSFGNGFEGTDLVANNLFATAYFVGSPTTVSGPVILGVENAAGGSPSIAPNTFIEIDGVNLAPPGDARTWQTADFVGNKMPTALDGVSVTVNGKSAYVYYISPTQIDVLTPPDAASGPVDVVVSVMGGASAAFTVNAQTVSPSFFTLGGNVYVAAEHAGGALIGPTTLYPGQSTPAKPGETVMLYANGLGPTSDPVVSGSITQSGTLSPLPSIQIGGITANVRFAGLVYPGEFQINVDIPASLANGDQPITATLGGVSTQPGTMITVHN